MGNRRNNRTKKQKKTKKAVVVGSEKRQLEPKQLEDKEFEEESQEKQVENNESQEKQVENNESQEKQMENKEMEKESQEKQMEMEEEPQEKQMENKEMEEESQDKQKEKESHEKQMEDRELEEHLQENRTHGDVNEEEAELNQDSELNGEGDQIFQDLDDEGHTHKESYDEPKRKRLRGPTKMKHIPRDPNERQHVDFTDMGEPCGPGSVLLSSFLGPLVHEHVPVVIENWRKVIEDIKTVLWKSIVARFDVDEDYKKSAVFKQMGCLWRSSKSRLVTQVREATTLKDRMSLRPNNVVTSEWRKFVKEKTSNAFKVVSDSYKERRKKQIPHTSGRRGMVRLREDLVKNSAEPSTVSRFRVWVKSRTRKDGTPVNINAAEKIVSFVY